MAKKKRIDLDERIEKALRRGVTLDSAILKCFERSSKDGIPQDGKSPLLMAFFVVILEHHRAISVLLRQGEYATSARSLMRPLLESSLRGAWLSIIASNEEVKQAGLGLGRFPGPAKIAKFLDDREPNTHFSAMVQQIDLLNDFTHTGINQISRQVSVHGLGQNYDSEECLALLNQALNIFAGGAVSILIGLGQEHDAAFISEWFQAISD